VSGDRQMLRDHLAAIVERLRVSRGMSVETLADRSLHEPEEVEAILRGEFESRLDTVILLAGALGVPPGELMKGSHGGRAAAAISLTRTSKWPSERKSPLFAGRHGPQRFRRYHSASAAG
jgi:transcriptional regulator with XRE-family HTH domain